MRNVKGLYAVKKLTRSYSHQKKKKKKEEGENREVSRQKREREIAGWKVFGRRYCESQTVAGFVTRNCGRYFSISIYSKLSREFLFGRTLNNCYCES